MLTLIVVLGAGFSAPRPAWAGIGYTFWESFLIGVAVGTVLGASTLPFYESPTDHLLNVAIGAGVGTLAGTGLGVYGLTTGSQSPSQGREDYYFDHSRRSTGGNPQAGRLQMWMPLVSLNW